MAGTYYAIFVLGLALELSIIWRGYRAGIPGRYPFFYAYMAYVLIRTLGLYALQEVRFPGYAVAYWVSETLDFFLQFLVVWEVFRHTFASRPPLRRVVGQVIALLLVGLAAVMVLFSENTQKFFLNTPRQLAFALAAFLAVTLFIAGYYSVTLGRNIRAMALGFGLYTSITVINFSAFQLAEALLPYWRFVHPSSFVACLLVWAWGMWSYAPNPGPELVPGNVIQLNGDWWKQAWNGLGTTLRRVVGL